MLGLMWLNWKLEWFLMAISSDPKTKVSWKNAFFIHYLSHFWSNFFLVLSKYIMYLIQNYLSI